MNTVLISYRLHVFSDLKPYICTVESCPSELAQFSTRKLWEIHEFNEHWTFRSWHCPFCAEVYNQPDNLERHLFSKHNYPMSTLQFHQIVKNAEVKTASPIENQMCPLCGVVPGKSRRNFATHVGRHMETIALAVLPTSAEDESDEDSIASTSDHRASINSQRESPRAISKFGTVDQLSPQLINQSGPPQLPTPQMPNQGLPHHLSNPTPTQSTPLKALMTKTVIGRVPTVRDHTTGQLVPEGDEYIAREYDEAGEKKLSLSGHLLNGREYKYRTFKVLNRGDKLFMLATECARALNYHDSYLLFNKNRCLYKIITTSAEMDDLIHQEILPHTFRSRQIAIVTARSIFRQFGSRIILDGRRVRDDYWEAKARRQGFTEEDLAGEKRSGAAKERGTADVAGAAALGHHSGIVHSNVPDLKPAPQFVKRSDTPLSLTRSTSTGNASSSHGHSHRIPQPISTPRANSPYSAYYSSMHSPQPHHTQQHYNDPSPIAPFLDDELQVREYNNIPRPKQLNGEEEKEHGRCPYPECHRLFKDLKAHMLTHQFERPEKCPITTCDYHKKGFARKHDKQRHILTHYKGVMVCGFCSESKSAAEKSFNRADVFKRHLTSVHGVEQSPLINQTKSPGKCSTCDTTFNNAQDFYKHLDECVLRVVQQVDKDENINERLLKTMANDYAVHETLVRNGLSMGFKDISTQPVLVSQAITRHAMIPEEIIQEAQNKALQRGTEAIWEGGSAPWSQEDDLQLTKARSEGLNWGPITSRYFPMKTPNACRKRHERLMEKRRREY